jgi:Right handed beta helix region
MCKNGRKYAWLRIILSPVFLVLLFVCLAPELALAATYYVDKSGNDSNSCTTAQDTAPEYAKQSITSALGCPSPGDTIIVRQGTYDEFISSYLFMIPSGTEGYPITLMANPGDTVTIEGGSDPTAWEALVQLYDVHYFVVSGFIIDGLGLATSCVTIEWPSTGIRIEYNDIKGSALSGVFIGASGTELIGNYIHDGGYYGGFYPPYGYGLYLTSYANLIEGNEVYNMGRYGMHFYSQLGSLHDNIITGNRIHNNNQAAGGAGMILGGQNNLVYNNLIYEENNGHGIDVDYSDPVENNEIVFNTIYNVAGYCLMIGADSPARGTVVKDNTLYGCGYGPMLYYAGEDTGFVVAADFPFVE